MLRKFQKTQMEMFYYFYFWYFLSTYPSESFDSFVNRDQVSGTFTVALKYDFNSIMREDLSLPLDECWPLIAMETKE